MTLAELLPRIDIVRYSTTVGAQSPDSSVKARGSA